MSSSQTPPVEATSVDVVVVGAGFAGLYAIHRLRSDGLRVRGIEAGGDVGGTWYWNRYPGARCDVESLDYAYSFDPQLQQEWNWTEKYATQPEILRYLQHVATRFDLRRDITFGSRVTAAVLDEHRLVWRVEHSGGDSIQARFLVLATGPLSVPYTPAIAGLQTFAGRTLHTGAWPAEPVDFTGRRVAVVGTGSSGIQVVPQIAPVAHRLYVLQRTPNFSIPARNFRWEPDRLAEAKADYPRRRARSWASAAGTPHPPPVHGTFDVDPAERQRIFEQSWQLGGARFARTFSDIMTNREANAEAAQFVRAKIRQTVHDPAVAERLMPQGYPFGAKRLCVDIDYYETFNRDNVELVDLRENPIERVEPTGVRLREGLLAVDDIVLATGFDAMVGAVSRIAIQGRGGAQLRDAWSNGPRSLLGLAVNGFPNLFVVNGPGSPSVLANMVLTSEHQVDWIANALARIRRQGLAGIEAQAEAQQQWMRHCADLAAGSLMLEGNSWYVGANIPGKPRVLLPYIGGLARYVTECDDVARCDYRGFHLIPATD